MDGSNASRRMSIGVVGRVGGIPYGPQPRQQINLRRQTIAPTMKENTIEIEKGESEDMLYEPNYESAFQPAASTLSSTHDHTSASLNTSYVSSSSSDQSSDRLNLSDASDTPVNQTNEQTNVLPTRPPLADHPRRQTMAPIIRREEFASMRRDRRRSMAPRINQATGDESCSKSSAESNVHNPLGTMPMGDIAEDDDEDVTGKLSLPTQAIQDIMNQASVHQFVGRFDGKPLRQSLPFEDAMDPPKIARTSFQKVCFSSKHTNGSDKQLEVESDDALDATANIDDIETLFGFVRDTRRESTNKSATAECQSHADSRRIESGHSQILSFPAQTSEPMRSPSKKKDTNGAVVDVDSPARNTRSSKKPLTQPLAMSPKRKTKSPTRSAHGRQIDNSDALTSSSCQSIANQTDASLGGLTIENGLEDQSSNVLIGSASDRVKSKSVSIPCANFSRHSLPLYTAKAFLRSARSKSMTLYRTTEQEIGNDDDSNYESHDDFEALSQPTAASMPENLAGIAQESNVSRSTGIQSVSSPTVSSNMVDTSRIESSLVDPAVPAKAWPLDFGVDDVSVSEQTSVHSDNDMDIEENQPTEEMVSDTIDQIGDQRIIEGRPKTTATVQGTVWKSTKIDCDQKLSRHEVEAEGLASSENLSFSHKANDRENQRAWDDSLTSRTKPGSHETYLTRPSLMVSKQNFSENESLNSSIQPHSYLEYGARMTIATNLRHPLRSSITPTKLTGAPARLANPLTAPTSDFKRNQSFTPSKFLLSVQKRAPSEQVYSESKRQKPASGLKSAMRFTKDSCKTKKVVAFKAPELLEFDPDFSVLTPIQGPASSMKHIDDDEFNVYENRADEVSVNLSQKLQIYDESSDVGEDVEREHTLALEMEMSHILDRNFEFLQTNSSGSSMDTTFDSSPESSPEEEILRHSQSFRASSIITSSIQCSMLPEASYTPQSIECTPNECSMSMDAVVDQSPSVINLEFAEIVPDEIRTAARTQAKHDALWSFLIEVKAFTSTQAVKAFMDSVIEEANNSMPAPIDYKRSLSASGDKVEAFSALQRRIRGVPSAVDPKLKSMFYTIQLNETAAWSSWVLVAARQLELVLAEKANILANRSKEIESLTQAIDQNTIRVNRAFSWSKRVVLEEKSQEISCLSVEVQELEEKLRRLSSTQKDLLIERSNLERILAHIEIQAELRDTSKLESECEACIDGFDLAAGLCKWRLRTITKERLSLDFIGQTSETCVNISFDTSTTPIPYSVNLERSLFPNKLRFARKFSATVSSFLKTRMKLLQESYGQSFLESLSCMPELVRSLALELVRADIVAMEIRTLDQRQDVSIEFADAGKFRVTANVPYENDQERLEITFLVSCEYPTATPLVTIHTFDKDFDILALERLIKHFKPGFGGIIRTLDSVKTFVASCKKKNASLVLC